MFKIYQFKKVKSTFDKAEMLDTNSVVIANKQTKGKGRFKRSWNSSSGGIYMSIVLEKLNPSYLTFIAAISAQKAIKESYGIETKIKWPNDLLFNKKKVCGILTTVKDKAIIGIGINTNNKIPKTKQEFEEFRDRELSQNLRNGVCRNLIQINNQEVQTNNKPSCQFLCPLHPTRHKSKEDLRLGHCDIHYLCKSAKIFKDWDKKTQEEFLNYIKTKQLSNIQYSLKMDDNSILEEFQHLQNNHSKD